MAKKSEAVIQRKDMHENRNALIVGSLLALLPLAIFILFFYSRGELPCKICPQICPPGSYEKYANGTIVITCMATSCMGGGFCPSAEAFDLLSIFFIFVYIPLGLVLYLASMKFDKENRLKLRFWGKSFFAGGIIGFVLLNVIIPFLVVATRHGLWSGEVERF